MKLAKPKYIFVTGGVASSLGKGIISASIARLLQARGYSVTIQKLDPYINVDPGTLNPYEHGECYVTEDGAETDLDLGHYERFTNHPTSKANNVTTGRIYKSVIEKERKGEYLGKTDKMGADVPHPVSHVAYGYATHVCILNEDGTIRKMVAAHDVGRVVNRKSLEGQIEGGTVMGCGYALTEQYPLDHCKPTAKFGTLGLFRADKAPDVEAIAIEKEGVDVAYGAIGVGEITSIPGRSRGLLQMEWPVPDDIALRRDAV